ncbi:transporter substrate-binding domain-containing protein [Pseudogracilibacillus auburnensis]|uniref:transporter substrate-binding domain-containing protein n=1 Tax=Pseudogracilibacillus auburnensis TaxID=1494959 RepID=UPI001A978D7F|nr:transporter substrate-binding domain-containing protein [Pseudogracilibacillus auburnensis]MBO1003202.1 transporter substrate-binding domain-containing protein [Pseudogracilibacillus auburnensis]
MKKISLIFTLALLVLLTFGCGAKDKESTTESGTKKDTLRIAVTEASPPMSYVNKDGDLVGFDVDYSKEIGKRLGREVEIISTAWEGILPGLLADKYDLIVGSMAITDERKKSVNFTDPYYISGAAIIVHESNDSIHIPEDLEGKSVGVTLGTTYEEEVNNLGANAKTYNTETDQLTDLENKRIEAMVTDKFIGAFTITESNRPLRLIDQLLYEEELGIAIRQGEEDLLKEVNEVIKEIYDDGTYEELAMKHFGTK